MNPYSAQPDADLQSSVMAAAGPDQLVVMLYDGAVGFLRQAEGAMVCAQWAQVSERVQRAEAIIDELLATLNPQAGEVAARLQAIYAFCRRCLIEARLERSTVKVAHVIRLLVDLREAWAHVASASVPGPSALASASAEPPALPA